MPHRRCRKSWAIFLCGMMCLFLWQASIYPVLGYGRDIEALLSYNVAKDNTKNVNVNVKADNEFSNAKAGPIRIEVQKGENLWNLAIKYHTTVKGIVELNQIQSPDQIQEGHFLWVPYEDSSEKVLYGDSSEKVSYEDSSAKVLNIETNAVRDKVDLSWWATILRSIPTFATINKQRPGISRSSNIQPAQPKIPTYEIIVNENTELSNKPQETVVQETESQVYSRSLGRLVSKEDVNLLTRVIYGEARGEDFVGQVAVGAVVLNRLKDPHFPKTIRSIIYQTGAFTAVQDKQIHLDPNDQAYKAAEAALSGLDPTNGALYYYNPRIATDRWIKSRPVIKRIGNHTFSI